MDDRDFGNIWQHSFTFAQPGDYHRSDDVPPSVLRDPMREVPSSSFLFPDYDPAFFTNFGQNFGHTFTGQHCVTSLSQIPDSSSGFGTLPVRQMIARTAPISSTSYHCAAKEFTMPFSTGLPSEPSYSFIPLDTTNPLSSDFAQSTSRIPVPTFSTKVRKISNEEPCQVCLAAASSGLHFGAKTCAACAAFFRRTVSDQKIYICKRSQRCGVKLNDVVGYRKICRSCRMKRCLAVGMLPENVQNKRQRKKNKSESNYHQQDHATEVETMQPVVLRADDHQTLSVANDCDQHNDRPILYQCIIP